MTLQAIVQNAATCAHAVGKAGSKVRALETRAPPPAHHARLRVFQNHAVVVDRGYSTGGCADWRRAHERSAMRPLATGIFSLPFSAISRRSRRPVSPRARLTVRRPHQTPPDRKHEQALAVQQTALGGTSPRGPVSQSRDRRGRASLAAAGAAGALISHSASPCVASVAPPPKSAPPILRHTRWTETEVFAPTKCGKLRRRRGGGGDENRDPRGAAGGGGGAPWGSGDGAFGAGEPADGAGADGSDGVFGSGDDGGDGGGSNWGGGGGGGGGDDGHDEINRWIDGEFVPGGGNLMWAWHTACGVALAGSVQHAVDAALADRRRGDADSAVAASCASAVASATVLPGASSAALEQLTAARAGMCLASISSAHALRQQPKLSMSA